jgi:hypothetical protein
MASRIPRRPRELRRRVLLPARMRVDSRWCDACILNISSHGLMIQMGRGAPCAEAVEVRRGEHVIRARVVWRDGSRAGLQADDCLPVEEILSLSQARSLQLRAGSGPVERRRQPRYDHERSRFQGRLIEFGGIAIIAGTFGLAIFSIVQQALGRPMAIVEAALGG